MARAGIGVAVRKFTDQITPAAATTLANCSSRWIAMGRRYYGLSHSATSPWKLHFGLIHRFGFLEGIVSAFEKGSGGCVLPAAHKRSAISASAT
jgi:hypothetical protein